MDLEQDSISVPFTIVCSVGVMNPQNCQREIILKKRSGISPAAKTNNLEGQADSWRRHLFRKQASVTALGVRPSHLPPSTTVISKGSGVAAASDVVTIPGQVQLLAS